VTGGPVAVVGAGTMGAGIAALAALHGVAVVLIDALPEALARARTRIERETSRAGDPGALARVTFATNLDAVRGAALVIEAVPEDLSLKQRLFDELALRLAPEALLATNTSALSVTEIARGVAAPERILGLHFFNPPTAMQLVEVVRTANTAEDVVRDVVAFAKELGRTPIVVRDTPGFVVNRVARPFYLQALRALAHGVADVPSLDALARGAGFPMGPFTLMDLIGVDVNLAVSTAVHDRMAVERLAPSPVQRRMVSAGKLGRKSGEGFYRYRDGSAELPPELPALSFPATSLPALALLDPDGVLAPLGAQARSRDVDVRTVRTAPEAALLGLPVAYDAYRFTVAELKRAGVRRFAGIGVVGPLEDQRAVEVVRTPGGVLGTDVLATLLAGGEREAIAVAEVPGLYLGATIASIVNEAALAELEGVAGRASIDLALQLGVRYPHGPFAWADRIGHARIVAILERMGVSEGEIAVRSEEADRIEERT
jgi:3-hydroxybutyryl-CoA dehydrogenase